MTGLIWLLRGSFYTDCFVRDGSITVEPERCDPEAVDAFVGSDESRRMLARICSNPF